MADRSSMQEWDAGSWRSGIGRWRIFRSCPGPHRRPALSPQISQWIAKSNKMWKIVKFDASKFDVKSRDIVVVVTGDAVSRKQWLQSKSLPRCESFFGEASADDVIVCLSDARRCCRRRWRQASKRCRRHRRKEWQRQKDEIGFRRGFPLQGQPQPGESSKTCFALIEKSLALDKVLDHTSNSKGVFLTNQNKWIKSKITSLVWNAQCTG